jgi:hypothetical protein
MAWRILSRALPNCIASRGGHFDPLIIEAVEGVVNDYPRSPRLLGDYPHGTDAQVPNQALVFLERPVGQHHPKSLLEEVKEFLAKEVSKFDHQFVRYPP